MAGSPFGLGQRLPLTRTRARRDHVPTAVAMPSSHWEQRSLSTSGSAGAVVTSPGHGSSHGGCERKARSCQVHRSGQRRIVSTATTMAEAGDFGHCKFPLRVLREPSHEVLRTLTQAVKATHAQQSSELLSRKRDLRCRLDVAKSEGNMLLSQELLAVTYQGSSQSNLVRDTA